MATIEYWIQLENRAWDVAPHNVDRMTGQTMKEQEGKDPVKDVLLTSPGSGASRRTDMFRPLRDAAGSPTDALILRRYKASQKADFSDAWTVPDDRKVNPWDLNEPDPTDNGTMGTIPGPTIECSVGDSVVVHFRNHDHRGVLGTEKVCFPVPFIGEICIDIPAFVELPVDERTHSLHPHGFVFAPIHDGAFPLSPPDSNQPIDPSEAAAWASGGVTGHKQGDRVPPDGTFTYHWNTFGWPTTAGVWLYHDHSICDMESTGLGAIGMVVIHNAADVDNEVDIRLPENKQDATGTLLDPAFLPGGSATGSPVQLRCFPLPLGFPEQVLPHDLEGLGQIGAGGSMGGMSIGGMSMAPTQPAAKAPRTRKKPPGTEAGPPVAERIVQRGDLILELDSELQLFRRFCTLNYLPPPSKALYLQLYHPLGDAGVCINGRKYLGNTPTVIGGPNTRMRFGVVGMGSEFHTFHIHGHRWILPGPHGNKPGAIQSSPLDTPVSQFEDVRTFGPANSFVFTIDEGNGFMRADPFTPTTPHSPIGEWHMHCHVLMHMDQGMMGSLLIINAGGGVALPLPKGRPCPMAMPSGGGGGTGGGAPMTATVKDTSSCQWRDDVSGTPETTIKVGGTVTWTDTGSCGGGHTVTSDNVAPFGTLTPPMNLTLGGTSQPHTFPTAGDYGYHCNVHGGNPVNKSGMWGIVHVVP